MTGIFAGIDPGVSGAVAIIEADGSVRLFDAPTRKATVGKEFLPAEMSEILRPYAGRCFLVLEKVEATRTPGQRKALGNVSASLKSGVGGGIWLGIIAAYQIPHEVVRASAWKREFRLIGTDKEASRARAQELFPSVAAELKKRRPDFAEALLLAEFGRRRREGSSGLESATRAPRNAPEPARGPEVGMGR